MGYGHLTAYTSGIIGCDRYLRMKYLHQYSIIVTARKIYAAVAVATLLSFFHSCAYVVGGWN